MGWGGGKGSQVRGRKTGDPSQDRGAAVQGNEKTGPDSVAEVIMLRIYKTAFP